jgi:hypothetical protein
MAKKTKKVTTTVVTTVTEEVVNTPLNDKTHIICVLDRSGSMSGIISDSIGGFNQFLKDQKKLPDKATITVHLFDDRHDCIYDCVDIQNAQELTEAVWSPRGTTALYDAIGKAINKDKQRFAALGTEKPSKVLVCVVTDGFENASTEYRRQDIQKLIRQCEDEDWNFIYLAANQDAFAVGQSFGIAPGNTFTYQATSDGVRHMSATLNCASTSYRGMSAKSANFKKMSKSLINDDPNKDDLKNAGDLNIVGTGDVNFGGSITSSGTNNITISNPVTTTDTAVNNNDKK